MIMIRNRLGTGVDNEYHRKTQFTIKKGIEIAV